MYVLEILSQSFLNFSSSSQAFRVMRGKRVCIYFCIYILYFMFLVFHLDRSCRSNEMSVILISYFFNSGSVSLNFLGMSFVFMRIYTKVHSYFWVLHFTNMFNIKYRLCMSIFDKPIHCVQNHFDSFNIHQAFLYLVL